MNFAIILSGGIGTRMRKDGFPKQYIKINGKTILECTIKIFNECNLIDEIVVVMAEVWRSRLEEDIKKKSDKKIKFALPGESRQESILSGLAKCMEESDDYRDKVIIHDAVRPLVSQALITKCLDKLPEYDGCMPVLQVPDATYFSEDGVHISQLLDRNELYAGQAPEAFMLHKYYELNYKAEQSVIKNTLGTSEIAFNAGFNICMIPGEDSNFKLTTPIDLERFKIIMGGTK